MCLTAVCVCRYLVKASRRREVLALPHLWNFSRTFILRNHRNLAGIWRKQLILCVPKHCNVHKHMHLVALLYMSRVVKISIGFDFTFNNLYVIICWDCLKPTKCFQFYQADSSWWVGLFNYQRSSGASWSFYAYNIAILQMCTHRYYLLA